MSLQVRAFLWCLALILGVVIGLAMYGAAPAHAGPGLFHFGTKANASLLVTAKRDLGRNPTSMRSKWCAAAINHWLRKNGHRGTGSNRALSFASYGRAAGPRPGAIGVMRRSGAGNGHVVVIESCSATHCRAVSPNNGRRKTAMVSYPRSRFIAFRVPG